MESLLKVYVTLESGIRLSLFLLSILVHVRKYHHVIYKTLFGKQESAGNRSGIKKLGQESCMIPYYVDES